MQRCEAGPPSCTSPGGTGVSPVDYYYHTDDLYNVMAVTDGAGQVVERYEYDDYGTPMVMDAAGNALALSDGTALTSSPIANPYLFTGRRYDPETAWYHYRTRYMDPNAGRFTTRDTIGIWGDPWEFGNGYAFVGNDPFSWLDPFGLSSDLPNYPPEGWPKTFKWDGETWVWRISEGHVQHEGHYDNIGHTRRLYPGDLTVESTRLGPKSRRLLTNKQLKRLKNAGIGGVAGIVLGFFTQFADALDHFTDKNSACGAWFKAANAGDCRSMGLYQDDCRDQLVAARLPHAALNFDNFANKAKHACEDAQARKKKREDDKKSGCNK
jgi:RHS repeat-associated protein